VADARKKQRLVDPKAKIPAGLFWPSLKHIDLQNYPAAVAAKKVPAESCLKSPQQRQISIRRRAFIVPNPEQPFQKSLQQ
jgi:hypothetical protein